MIIGTTSRPRHRYGHCGYSATPNVEGTHCDAPAAEHYLLPNLHTLFVCPNHIANVVLAETTDTHHLADDCLGTDITWYHSTPDRMGWCESSETQTVTEQALAAEPVHA